MGRVRRYDDGEVLAPVRTVNGYLRCDARITRTGVFDYRLLDGTVRRELRLPEDVFKADSLSTFEDVPLTNGHPREKLDASNTNRFQAGSVRGVRQLGHSVAASVLVTDAQAIADAEAGKTQLSCGYDCDLEHRSGVTDGSEGVDSGLRYDAVQRNIVGNHVAIVTSGRAGPDTSLRLDGADAAMVHDAAPTPFTGPESGRSGVKTMKVRIDGVDYEVDETAGQATMKLIARCDALEEKVTKLGQDVTAQTVRADTAEESLDAEKKARADDASDDKIRASVRSRVALETAAAKVLGPEHGLKLDEMDETAIKCACIVKVSPAAEKKLDSEDAAYINARFDVALESHQAAEKKRPSASTKVRAALPDTLQRHDSKSARDRMLERNFSAGREAVRPTPMPKD